MGGGKSSFEMLEIVHVGNETSLSKPSKNERLSRKPFDAYHHDKARDFFPALILKDGVML